MEYSIQEVAKAAGTTSRTLRHYDAIGLLSPSRVGQNGYRYYDDRSLVRLQRVLLLKQLGLALDAIGEVLEAQDAAVGAASRGGDAGAGGAGGARQAGGGAGEASGGAGEASGGAGGTAESRFLARHLDLLREEQQRIQTQIAAVERTIAALTSTHRGTLMEQNIFEGFDHRQHREEVEARWGEQAYATSDRWWRGLGADAQTEWMQRVQQLNSDWGAVAERGDNPASTEAQALAKRHVEWLRSIPGTPAHEPGGDLAGYVLGLGDMYVTDERFAANYGGVEGAVFVRDALRHYVTHELAS